MATRRRRTHTRREQFYTLRSVPHGDMVVWTGPLSYDDAWRLAHQERAAGRGDFTVLSLEGCVALGLLDNNTHRATAQPFIM